MMSLNLRVLLVASAVLSSFFGLAGFTLERAYRQSVEQALTETLRGHVFTLIASGELGEGGRLNFPEVIPDPLFSSLGSGLFAQVASNDGSWRWHSAIMAGMEIPFPSEIPRTEQVVSKISHSTGRELYLFSYGVVWGDASDPALAYTFSVAQDLTTFNQDISQFRRNLWGSLGGVALLLLALQGTILRWGLLPLRRASEQLGAIETGSQSSLQGPFPKELQGLTGSVNALLAHQHGHLERYRKSLGDLAHSLKTPLAVLQNAAGSESADKQLLNVVREQVGRMDQITGYQLQRAASAGWMVLSAPVPVKAVVNKVLNGLKKVYADKNIKFTLNAEGNIEFHGDEGDLLEIIGNLADNACEWCQHRVAVYAEYQGGDGGNQKVLLLRVEDDGPGIPMDMVKQVTQRGHRVDSDKPGHGIGLSIVQDIVKLYGGTLEVTSNRWGGACVKVSLSARPAEKTSAQN